MKGYSGQMARVLSTTASRHHTAAVLTNQVTTKVNDALGTWSLVPALGDSWAHVCNIQLSLQWRDGQRLACLYKGLAPGEALYRVTEEGIRSATHVTTASHLALPASSRQHGSPRSRAGLIGVGTHPSQPCQ